MFNHCRRASGRLHHLLENGASSPYADWFITEQRASEALSEKGVSPVALTAGGIIRAAESSTMPIPKCVEHVAVGRHWIERGIDGWRLDVPDEVEPKFRLSFAALCGRPILGSWIRG